MPPPSGTPAARRKTSTEKAMFDKQTYIARRKALHAKLSGGLVLLPGNDESPANYPGNTFRFRQDSTFLYFFRAEPPGLLRPARSGFRRRRSVRRRPDPRRHYLTGPQPSLAELAGEVGVEKTQSAAHLQKRIEAAVAKGRRILFLPPYRGETCSTMSRLLGIRADRLASYASAGIGARRRRVARGKKSLRRSKRSNGPARPPAKCTAWRCACAVRGLPNAKSPGRSKASPCNTEPEYRSRRS